MYFKVIFKNGRDAVIIAMGGYRFVPDGRIIEFLDIDGSIVAVITPQDVCLIQKYKDQDNGN